MKMILVIDDSPTIRTSVEYSLKPLSFPVKQAENGLRGLEVYGEIVSSGAELAMVVVDVNMPEMDGISFIKEFRKKDRFTPILVLTTESEEHKVKEGKDAGASGWMIKPFKPADILAVAQKLIK